MRTDIDHDKMIDVLSVLVIIMGVLLVGGLSHIMQHKDPVLCSHCGHTVSEE